MVVIGMRVDAEKAAKYLADDAAKVGREGPRRLGRKDVLRVELPLHPAKQVAHIVARAELHRLRDPLVGPRVVADGPVRQRGAHDWARRLCAKLGHEAVHEIGLVEQVESLHGEPLVEALPGGQSHGFAQAARAERPLSERVYALEPRAGL